MDFNGNQTVQGPNESFSAASKGFKRHQTMNKGHKDPYFWVQLLFQIPKVKPNKQCLYMQ